MHRGRVDCGCGQGIVSPVCSTCRPFPSDNQRQPIGGLTPSGGSCECMPGVARLGRHSCSCRSFSAGEGGATTCCQGCSRCTPRMSHHIYGPVHVPWRDKALGVTGPQLVPGPQSWGKRGPRVLTDRGGGYGSTAVRDTCGGEDPPRLSRRAEFADVHDHHWVCWR